MKKIFSLMFLFLLALSLDAQIVVKSVGEDATIVEEEHFEDSIPNNNIDTEFRVQQLIAPVSLFAVGSLGFIPEVKELVIDVRDNVLDWRGACTTEIDDYLQYVPHISYYGLSLAGLDAKHNYVDRTLVFATSTIATVVLTRGAKYLFSVERPDGVDNKSFPSGHTATVFMGAELVRMEYGEEYPLIGVGAYTLAAAVAACRVYNNKHWVTDVIAGAGVGILGAKIGYWLLPHTRRWMHKLTGHDAFVYPMVGNDTVALGVSLTF